MHFSPFYSIAALVCLQRMQRARCYVMIAFFFVFAFISLNRTSAFASDCNISAFGRADSLAPSIQEEQPKYRTLYAPLADSASADSTADSSERLLTVPRPFRYTFDGSLPKKRTEIDVGKALLYGGAYSAGIAGAQIYQYNAFWQNRLTFRIIDDGDLEFGADKYGHIFAGYIMSKLSADVLLTIGVGEDIAVVGGGLLGLGYQFFVEVQDGYGFNWGFSPSDMAANAFGSALHIAQKYVPFARHIQMKADFYPADWIGEKTRKNAVTPIDDYSAWTWWFSFDVNGLLPQEAKGFWPPWLRLALGYAARNLEWDGEESRRFIISLDYDLEKILPDGAPLWNWFKQYLNLLKLPAPAVEFGFLDDRKGNLTPTPVRAYILFPFKLGSFSFSP
jgi:hypothetical protein